MLCDVHNVSGTYRIARKTCLSCLSLLQTLVNTVLRKYASKELMDKYLPQLSTEVVSLPCTPAALARAHSLAP